MGGRGLEREKAPAPAVGSVEDGALDGCGKTTFFFFLGGEGWEFEKFECLVFSRLWKKTRFLESN